MTASQLDRDLYCLRRAGYLVIPDFIAPDVLDKIDCIGAEFAAEIASFKAAGGIIPTKYFWPLITTRCLYALSTEIQDVAMDDRLQAIVRGYLRSPVLRDCVVQSNMPDADNAARGVEAAVSYHRDSVWQADEPVAPQYLHAFVLLTDFTAANGATLIVPGSHRSKEPGHYFKKSDPPRTAAGIRYGVYDKAYFASAVHVEARRGAVLFMDGMTIHTQGNNTTSHKRTLVNITFREAAAPGWPLLLNARSIAARHARVPIRPDLFELLEEDDSRPDAYGPLGNPWPAAASCAPVTMATAMRQS